jgi:hypothetical protein
VIAFAMFVQRDVVFWGIVIHDVDVDEFRIAFAVGAEYGF